MESGESSTSTVGIRPQVLPYITVQVGEACKLHETRNQPPRAYLSNILDSKQHDLQDVIQDVAVRH